VPTRWYEYEQKVDRVQKELQDEFKNNPHVAHPELIVDKNNKKKGGKRVMQIEIPVYEEKYTEIAENTPDERNDVPINVRRKQKDPAPTSSCHNTSYSDMMGGVAIEVDDDGDGYKDSSYCTSACRVGKSDENLSNDYLLTCNHVFLDGDYSCEGNWNDHIYSWGDYQEYGEVYEYDQTRDYALIEPDSDSNIDPHIMNSQWGHKVETNKTRNGLKDLMSDPYHEVEQMGVATGGRTGQVLSIDNSYTYGCIDLNGNGVRTSTGGSGGDSGGPIYTESCCFDGLSMISIVTSSALGRQERNWTCDGDPIFTETAGPAAHEMNEHWDVIFHG
jgi:hypothetical protein